MGRFKYFERGDECINSLVALLPGQSFFSLHTYLQPNIYSSSIAESPALLAYHFLSVAFYFLWVMFSHPSPVPHPPSSRSNGNSNGNGHTNGVEPVYPTPSLHQYIAPLVKGVQFF
ncbi:hypothetical protein GALMADRAFT_1118589 [Galerina marginata CBS 339.88]|uniref:Uncharacterized protein n=1 Tax=Galerina marginata (strain CBS 339.88) TaxID=685588 RepID=A0A067TM74_GALM3|nr:hypothetical protein GALMADRAFT_1118589 [Galerina marginata CBS 339.88]